MTPSIRLIRALGRGGMGSVWVAEHLRLHTEIVVKFMAAEYAADPVARRRFEREATLAARAKSPHVVQVFDHGVSVLGFPYIAMELLVGETLGQRIERQGRIDASTFARWLKQACSGLARAHHKGIVHRDIKPENVFLCDEDGEVVVKVLDFGIAKSRESSTAFAGTKTGALMGTAYYMSPEQTMGRKDVDARADLWALGVVSYYALTGTRPFEADAIGVLVGAITNARFIPPSSRWPPLGPAIDRFMARALSPSLENRFQSAKELADAFCAAAAESAGVVGGAHHHDLTDAAMNAATAQSGPDSVRDLGPSSVASIRGGLAVSTMAAAVRQATKLGSGRATLAFVVAALGVVLAAGLTVHLRSNSTPVATGFASAPEIVAPSASRLAAPVPQVLPVLASSAVPARPVSSPAVRKPASPRRTTVSTIQAGAKKKSPLHMAIE